jgi:hypothetical protein
VQIIIVRIIPYYKRRLRRRFLVPNTSTSLKTTLAVDAHLAEGQFLIVVVVIIITIIVIIIIITIIIIES